MAPATIFDKVADFQHIPKARYEIKYVSEISPKKKKTLHLFQQTKKNSKITLNQTIYDEQLKDNTSYTNCEVIIKLSSDGFRFNRSSY